MKSWNNMLGHYKAILCFVLIFAPQLMSANSSNNKLVKGKDGVYQMPSDLIEFGIGHLDSVLVAFYSPKCRSCLAVESELAKVVPMLSAKSLDIHVAKVDISKDKSLVDRYQLKKMPTLIFFVAGGIAKLQQDKQPKAKEIAEWLESVCNSPPGSAEK